VGRILSFCTGVKVGLFVKIVYAFCFLMLVYVTSDEMSFLLKTL